MRFDLARGDYERLYLLARGEDPASKSARKCIAEQYPIQTAGVVVELRTRGLNVDAARLDYLIRTGAIPEPSDKETRNRRWTPSEIDRAADHLASINDYTPCGLARQYYNINAGQDEARLQAVLSENPHITRDHLVMVILPGAPGVDLYNPVDYREMSTNEQVAWLSAIKQHQQAMRTVKP